MHISTNLQAIVARLSSAKTDYLLGFLGSPLAAK
jgi:hypothetical protein